MSNVQKILVLLLALLVNVFIVLSLIYPTPQEQQENGVKYTNSSEPMVQTRYYRIIKEIYSDHSQSPSQNVGQFITFNGDEAFESNIVGQNVGNGTLKVLSSNNGVIEYVGGSYWGTSIKYTFTDNMQTLHIYANNITFHARCEEPPSDKTTCSYIKESESSSDPSYNPVDVQVTYSNGHNISQPTRRRLCRVCNGKGWYVYEIWLGSAGADAKHWCNECGKKVSAGHQHKYCESCGGTGWIEE